MTPEQPSIVPLRNKLIEKQTKCNNSNEGENENEIKEIFLKLPYQKYLEKQNQKFFTRINHLLPQSCRLQIAYNTCKSSSFL